MDIRTLRSFFGWCTVIDYGVLLLWTLVFWLAHDWHYGLTNRFFAVSVETYDLINLCGISFFKIAIILLNLVPYFALLIAAGRKS
jgi:hypothetical protein